MCVCVFVRVVLVDSVTDYKATCGERRERDLYS